MSGKPVAGPQDDPAVVVRLKPEDVSDPVWLEQCIERGRLRLERIPVRFRNAAPTEDLVRRWVRHLVKTALEANRRAPKVVHGPSLVITGSVGVGKTHQAYGALRALSLSGCQCAWEYGTAADIYGGLRPKRGASAEEEFDRLANASVLVLDDLGAAKESTWTEEITYRLVNNRYENELPTLFTTNLTPAQMPEELGQRVASRLMGMAYLLTMTGDDKRKPQEW